MRMRSTPPKGISAGGRSWIIRNCSLVAAIQFFGPHGNNALIRNNVLLGGYHSLSLEARSAHIEGNNLSGPFLGSTPLAVKITSGTVLGNTFPDLEAGDIVGYGNNTFSNSTPPLGGAELHPNVCNGAPCP